MTKYLNFLRAGLTTGRLDIKYAVAFFVGILIGFKVIGPPIVGGLYVLGIGIAIMQCIGKSVNGFFTVIPYLMYLESFVRKRVGWLPYLTMQYVFIGCFAYLILSGVRNKEKHFTGFFFLAIFTMIEVLNNIYPNKLVISRSIITHSIALVIPVIWASYNILSSGQILRLLTHIKIAGIMLTGIVIVAHLTGGVDYSLQSSSSASNGLPPVQLSAYFGLVCILFFFSIMNPEEVHQQWMNIGILTVVATIMILTFSRGGIYFVGAIAASYFFYNRSRMGSYFKFILLIPIAALIYYAVIETTGGKIVERYELKGSSGRDELVQVAFLIFSQHILTGVGTGNFNTVIVQKSLYSVESGAHNEFARSAAEHGILGIMFYWGFFAWLFIDITRRRQPQQQYAMYFFLLFCLIVVHNGLKISIQPIILVLAISISSKQIESKFNAYVARYRRATVA